MKQPPEHPGIVLRHELLATGTNDRAIGRLVRRRELHRVRRGAFADGFTWAALDDNQRYAALCRAAYRQARVPVTLSHVSAAVWWGAPLWDVAQGAVHLTRDDGRTGRKEAGIQQHRGLLLPEDIHELDGVRLVSPTRAALELTTLLDVEHSMVELDWMLHESLTTVERLRERYASMTTWPYTLRTDLVLRLVDGRAESVLESRGRYLCWSQGLPAPIPNYEIRDHDGHVVARVDLAWPELGVFVELDGHSKYVDHLRPGETTADAVVREKQRESMIRELTGWTCIRLTWADLARPEATAARIRRQFRPAAA